MLRKLTRAAAEFTIVVAAIVAAGLILRVIDGDLEIRRDLVTGHLDGRARAATPDVYRAPIPTGGTQAIVRVDCVAGLP